MDIRSVEAALLLRMAKLYLRICIAPAVDHQVSWNGRMSLVAVNEYPNYGERSVFAHLESANFCKSGGNGPFGEQTKFIQVTTEMSTQLGPRRFNVSATF